jgi:hypothetical protein
VLPSLTGSEPARERLGRFDEASGTPTHRRIVNN